jgi:hypothetical protein
MDVMSAYYLVVVMFNGWRGISSPGHVKFCTHRSRLDAAVKGRRHGRGRRRGLDPLEVVLGRGFAHFAYGVVNFEKGSARTWWAKSRRCGREL